jgi:hypothetical protein
MDLSLISARRHLQRPPGRGFHGLALEGDEIHGQNVLDFGAKSNAYGEGSVVCRLQATLLRF